MNLRALFLAWMVVVLALPTVQASASDGWFGGSSKPAANGVTTNSKKTGVSAWLPTWPTSKPKAKSNKPSMVTSVTKGTKKAWTNTVSFLNPFDNPPKTTTQSSAVDKGANSDSWWPAKKSKSEKPETMNDWLGGKKPSW